MFTYRKAFKFPFLPPSYLSSFSFLVNPVFPLILFIHILCCHLDFTSFYFFIIIELFVFDNGLNLSWYSLNYKRTLQISSSFFLVIFFFLPCKPLLPTLLFCCHQDFISLYLRYFKESLISHLYSKLNKFSNSSMHRFVGTRLF